jgi:hypothetical protein
VFYLQGFSPAGVLTSQGGWRGNLCHNTPRFHPQLSVVGGGIEICCFLTHITTRLKSPPPCRTPPTPLTPPPTPLLRSAAPPLLHYMILLIKPSKKATDSKRKYHELYKHSSVVETGLLAASLYSAVANSKPCKPSFRRPQQRGGSGWSISITKKHCNCAHNQGTASGSTRRRLSSWRIQSLWIQNYEIGGTVPGFWRDLGKRCGMIPCLHQESQDKGCLEGPVDRNCQG